MKSIVRFFLKQSVFINVTFVILVIAGIFSMKTIPVENMPNVGMGQVFIHTVYFGASADDVEKLVTTKIEDALDTLENVEYIQSRSYRNFSSVMVKFNDDTDYRDLYDELRFRALNIKDELPPGADEPTFIYIDTYQWLPVVIVNLVGDLPQRSLKLYAEELKASLLNAPDVRSVDIQGEFEREFHVSVDPEKLRRFGVTFTQVADAIQSANTKYPTGRFRTGETQYMLDAGRRLASQEAVLAVVVRRDGDGNFIRVRDLVTSARMSHRDPAVIPSVNGLSTLRVWVTKEERGNALDVSKRVKEIARAFEADHRDEGLGVVFTNDSSIEIKDSVNILGGNLILGLSLVTLVLWATVGFRNAMLTAIGIPFAFLCAVIIMRVTGVSLNSISLFSFVLVTGIMVDDAVIIMENVYRHLQMGKRRIEAVVDGTAEVMLPVISSALTTVLAFIPMLIMSGSTGEFFAQIPKTVSYALAASLLEALLILPIHFLEWGPKGSGKQMVSEAEDPFHHLRTGLFSPLWKLYHRLVRLLLDHKVLALGGIAGLFVVSVAMLVLSITGIAPLIKVKFFPGNYFRYHVTLAMPPGTAIERTDAVLREMSRYIMSLGERQALAAAATAGYYEDEDWVRHSGDNFGEIVVTLPEQKDRDFPENPDNDPIRHLAFIRERMDRFQAERFGDDPVRPRIRVFPESDGPPTGKPVNIRVTAPTLERALDAADRITAFMGEHPEMDDLVDLADDRPRYHKTVTFLPRPESVFEYDLLPGRITGIVAGALNGFYAGEFRDADEEVDLLVRLARQDDPAAAGAAGLSGPTDILDVPVVEHSAAPVLLRDLVTVSYEREADVRVRYKGRPTVTLTADIAAGSKLSPARVQVLVSGRFGEIKAEIPGVSLSFGGEFESTSRSYTSLTFAFFIAVLAIYLVLSSQFNSYVQPAIIISAVAFSLIGVVMGLFFSRTTFTVGSFLAIVGLAGVAVNDSLLMIDFMNVRQKRGRPLRDAVIEACATRMRPVLITTVTTLIGLLPMAIGIPRRSISWAPMATAFVAGLSSATLLTLIIIPVEYEAFHRIKARFSGKKG